jgi:hypothetical protein
MAGWYLPMYRAINGKSRAGASVALASELHETRLKAHQLGIEFLRTELQLARAFLDLAETTRNAAATRRNMRNTAKALDAVGRFIETLNPGLPQRQELSRHAAQVRARLLDISSRLPANGYPEQSQAAVTRETRVRTRVRPATSPRKTSTQP